MTTKLSLTKRAEAVKLSLKKSGVVKDKITLRVACALDISGSMYEDYVSGNVSELVDRLLPVANNVDDNSEIDMWAFNHVSQELPPATPANYGNYVGDAMANISISGGTNYSPVIEDIAQHYFGVEQQLVVEKRPSKGFLGKFFGLKDKIETLEEKPVTDSDTPALVFFITDGECGDAVRARATMKRVADESVYWMMVGIGAASSFRFLQDLANEYPNVGFISFDSLDLSDEEIYNAIINGELAQWINQVT